MTDPAVREVLLAGISASKRLAFLSLLFDGEHVNVAVKTRDAQGLGFPAELLTRHAGGAIPVRVTSRTAFSTTDTLLTTVLSYGGEAYPLEIPWRVVQSVYADAGDAFAWAHSTSYAPPERHVPKEQLN